MSRKHIYSDKEWISSCLGFELGRVENGDSANGCRNFFFQRSNENIPKLIVVIAVQLYELIKNTELYNFNK